MLKSDDTEQVTATPPAKPSRFIYWGAALTLAAVLLFFSLRGVEWRKVGIILRTAHIEYILLGLVTSTSALFLRAIRWRILLQAGAPISVATAFWATAAGYFGNNFLPARAGELVRTIMISAKSGLNRTFVLTTALSERLSDAIALVVISSLILLTLPVRPGWFDRAAKPFALAGLGGAIAILVLPKLDPAWRYLLGRMPIPHHFRERALALLQHVLTGIGTFHNAGRLFRFVSLTAIIWLLDGIGTVIGMRALNMNVSLPVALLLITGLALGSALPSTPGALGIYQFVTISVLTPFGFSSSNAIAYSFLAQALQYVLITFWGLFGITRYRSITNRTSIKPTDAAASSV